MDNKLRLQIVTELDAAGIKATKEQVDSLELGLRRAGKSGGDAGEKFGALERELGKLPGPIGGIGKALGGVAGQLTMCVGVFTTGFHIGEKLREWTIAAYEWAAGIKEAREAAEFATKQTEELGKAAEAAAARQIASVAKLNAKHDENVRKIDDETSAYMRQVDALAGIRKAQGDAEMMRLQREKYENVRQFKLAGNDDAAQQIGAYYDVLMAERERTNALKAFDEESKKGAAERAAAEEKAAKAVERTDEAYARLTAAKEKLDRIMSTERGSQKAKLGAAQMKIVEDAQKRYDEAVRREDKIANDIEVLDAKGVQRELDRSNLYNDKTSSIVRAADTYDDIVMQADPGNLLNASFGDWGDEIIREYQRGNEISAEICERVSSFGDMLEKLLEVKQ